MDQATNSLSANRLVMKRYNGIDRSQSKGVFEFSCNSEHSLSHSNDSTR
jgi:hypothetical protein